MFLSLLRRRVARFALPEVAQLWLVYTLFFVAGVAQAAIVPLLPRLTGRFDLTASQAALLLALPGLATLAVSVPSGVAADRLGARRVTLAAGALLGLSCVAQATPSLPALLLGRIVFGVAFGVVWTTGMAWLAELSKAGGRSGMGPSVTCSSVGIMVGPAVGGILAQSAGLGAPFVAIAVTTALLVAALAGGTAEGDATPAPQVAPNELPLEITYSQPPIADVPGLTPRALLAMARRPRVSAAAAALVVSGAVSSASQLLVSGDLHRLGLSTGEIGVAFSAAAIFYIVVSAAVVRLGHRAHTLRINALATAALAGALLPALTGDGLVVMMAALLLAAGPRAVISTIAYSLASDRGRRDGRGDGVVFGMLNGAWAAATVLIPLLAGAAEQRGGPRAGYLAVIIPACLIAGWLVLRSPGETRHARTPVRSAILQRVLRS
ncbi:MAG: MFS transporter [Solirubrobacteraceae bacterium]